MRAHEREVREHRVPRGVEQRIARAQIAVHVALRVQAAQREEERRRVEARDSGIRRCSVPPLMYANTGTSDGPVSKAPCTGTMCGHEICASTRQYSGLSDGIARSFH
jgi:hypothetical protein